MFRGYGPFVIIGVQTLTVTLIIALFVGKKSSQPAPLPPPSPPVVNPNPPPSPPPPDAPEPGDKVRWIKYPAKQSYNNSGFGPVLLDIERHIDPSHKGAYRDQDLLTWGHETTHGINSDIRNNLGKPGQNGFYCLEDCALVLNEPKLTITKVAPLVPRAVRGGRYQLYLVQQTSGWNDMPTYIMDEWVAYINGTSVGADQLKNGLHVRDNTSDDAIAPMEFTYYALALCSAVKKYDPDYFRTNPDFAEFVAFNIRRSVILYRELITEEKFRWDDSLVSTFISSAETADLKAVAVELWGQEFVNKYLLQK